MRIDKLGKYLIQPTSCYNLVRYHCIVRTPQAHGSFSAAVFLQIPLQPRPFSTRNISGLSTLRCATTIPTCRGWVASAATTSSLQRYRTGSKSTTRQQLEACYTVMQICGLFCWLVSIDESAPTSNHDIRLGDVVVSNGLG